VAGNFYIKGKSFSILEDNMNNWIYWRYDELFDRQVKILEAWTGSERNKELIRRFQDHLFTTGAKQARVAKLTWGLRKICDVLGVDLDMVTKADIERLVGTIQRDDSHTDSTKSDYKRCLKHFYRWFEDEDLRLESKKEAIRHDGQKLYQYLKKNVKTSCPMRSFDPGSIITDEDIKQILDKGCRLDYERALIKLLHETGARVGEILGIKIRDIQDKESHWLITVNGKTGERTVPIREAVPYLAQWMNHHPNKEDPEASLWISDMGQRRGKPLRYVGIIKIIDRCFKRAGVQKKHNPHHFRHSRATLDGRHYSEPILCKLRGWTIGSSQVRRYTHLSGKDAEDAFLRYKGLKPNEKGEESGPKECICGVLNTPDSKYCHKCGKALNIDVIQQEQDYLSKAFEIMNKIMSDPEMREKYEDFKMKEEKAAES